MNIPPMAPRHEKPDRKCETCAFFVHAGPGEDFGNCHRHAPRPVLDFMISDGTLMAYWPEADIGDFCGEWSLT